MRDWIYVAEGEEWVTIGSERTQAPPDPRVHAVALNMIFTDDREEAEQWRQALARGEIPKHDHDASCLAFLRMAHREWGLSFDVLAQRHRREPEMAELVEILRAEAEGGG